MSKPVILDDVEFKPSQNCLNGQDWNWSSYTYTDEVIPANYYESSLAPWITFSALEKDLTCDVVVVGAGLLGASAALHLAERGLDVVLVDKDRVGSAASGRNGGQLTPGLARWEAEDMIHHLSHEDAKQLWQFTSVEAMQLIDDISAKYELNLARSYGHITAAVHPGHVLSLTKGADARTFLGESNTKIVGKHELFDYVKSETYHGGLIDDLGGQIHPLALNRGLVHGFLHNGGTVYENTAVTSISEQSDCTIVETAHGTIKARQAVVMAVHHASFELLEEKPNTTIPFFTYVGVTKPLDINLGEILPKSYPVYDTQLQIDYYRGVSKNRLLFGGQGTGSCWSPEKTSEYLLGRISRVFPQVESTAFDFVWSGMTDLTVNGAVDSRKTEAKAPVYAVHGWSGHGVAQTVRIGKAIADDVFSENKDYDRLTQIEHRNIPLGRIFAPVAIPLAKCMYSAQIALQPGKMISF
ncbi:NAD(P)/FAD-dependent oxidoreductase [Acinetobacter boissieri]|uniref:Glycine/D-amino acid oxidase n=1 Tax=Acinetobacter boissieri TaxID=1219383 RepID=A0A1G6GII1_9GAMM|nr:FAD-binding oxidoreductase [Acinetobacter boissieri]SDB81811.1 Glycine/D-amino acid oxidase [Acinetobacter boissieri]